MDLRKILYSNIVLSGGSTLFKGDMMVVSLMRSLYQLPCMCTGFGDRLLSEMKKQTPRDIKIRVNIVLILLND